jgi:hypothetical protein
MTEPEIKHFYLNELITSFCQQYTDYTLFLLDGIQFKKHPDIIVNVLYENNMLDFYTKCKYAPFSRIHVSDLTYNTEHLFKNIDFICRNHAVPLLKKKRRNVFFDILFEHYVEKCLSELTNNIDYDKPVNGLDTDFLEKYTKNIGDNVLYLTPKPNIKSNN